MKVQKPDEAEPHINELADELEEIAQRLNEIGQDDFGKVSWTKAEHRKANNAVAAVKKSVIVIQRRLNNEDPVS